MTWPKGEKLSSHPAPVHYTKRVKTVNKSPVDSQAAQFSWSPGGPRHQDLVQATSLLAIIHNASQ